MSCGSISGRLFSIFLQANTDGLHSIFGAAFWPQNWRTSCGDRQYDNSGCEQNCVPKYGTKNWTTRRREHRYHLITKNGATLLWLWWWCGVGVDEWVAVTPVHHRGPFAHPSFSALSLCVGADTCQWVPWFRFMHSCECFLEENFIFCMQNAPIQDLRKSSSTLINIK